MALRSLTIVPLEIPFKVAFKHASAERKKTQSVLVIAESDRGTVGYGEGCPREYVTKESVAGCLEFFSRHREEWMSLEGYEDLLRWTEAHESRIDENPAAWCAVESSLLDLFSALRNQSVEKTLGLAELSGPFAYSAVLGDAPLPVFQAQARQYAALGFTDFKVKVSGDVSADIAKLACLRETAKPGFRLRLDANNLWENPSDTLSYLQPLPYRPFALEEPLRPFDYAGLVEIAERASVRVILDESFLRREHFDFIRGRENLFAINLRVSKMGGITRSLKIAEQARRTGVPLVIGAQVGETSILTRAAWTVAHANRKNLLAQEGAFGTLLLESDLVRKPIQFGKGGLLDPRDFLDPALPGFGLAWEMPLALKP